MSARSSLAFVAFAAALESACPAPATDPGPTIGAFQVCQLAIGSNGETDVPIGSFVGAVVADSARLAPRTAVIPPCSGTAVLNEEIAADSGIHVIIEIVDDATALRHVLLPRGDNVTTTITGALGLSGTEILDIVDASGPLVTAAVDAHLPFQDPQATLAVSVVGPDVGRRCGDCGCDEELAVKFVGGSSEIDLKTTESAIVELGSNKFVLQNNVATRPATSVGNCIDEGDGGDHGSWTGFRTSLDSQR